MRTVGSPFLLLFIENVSVKISLTTYVANPTGLYVRSINCNHHLSWVKMIDHFDFFCAGTIWRPTGLSLVYLVLMLYSPMVPIPTHETMNGHTGRYLMACMILSFLTTLTQFTFHVVLLSLPPYGYFLEACSFLEELFRHLGLVRMDGASVWEVFFWLLPEIVALPITVAMYCFCKRLTWAAAKEDDESSTVQPAKKAHEDGKNKVHLRGPIRQSFADLSEIIVAKKILSVNRYLSVIAKLFIYSLDSEEKYEEVDFQ